ncbi:HDOD domain-containing protein [Pontibacterium granulatum]|uniref:EAL and HDOD domain-containing protein n=1 Tax=Pontibacterium granulatum TaxID=2036029 RepID=UPI00249A35B4|nr:HDOD domain-containing protein [Pontibacterium granulatum]MDI3326518.1 HDOD domain-containing protein [Pontibacterium granulatum]
MEDASTNILMARQPIFDRELRVVAHELLYRSSGNRTAANVFDGNQATCDVLINHFTSIFDRGNQSQVPVFINLTEDLLSGNSLPAFDNKQVVLEVLEDVTVTDEVITAVRHLVSAGYRIALDDFEYSPAHAPLLHLAHIVKVDLTITRGDDLATLVKQLQPFKVTLLAEKIETEEEFQTCVDLGFKLFQGYFLSRPQVIEGRKISDNELVLIELLAALDDPGTSPQHIEGIIARDPRLTLKLLRIVNSSRYALVQKVESLAQAIVMIGFAEIKKWATLISLSSNSNKPSELTLQTLTTAYMCERVAQRSADINASSAFLVGMLSTVHAMLGISKEVLLERLPMSDEIVAALTDRSGVLGHVLANAEHYMAGEWDTLSQNIDLSLYREAYESGAIQATESLQQMSGLK